MSLRAALRRLLARLLRRRRGDGPALAALAAQIAPLLPPGRTGPLHVALGPDGPRPMGEGSAHGRLAMAPALAPLADPLLARLGYTSAHLPPASDAPFAIVLGRDDGSGTVVHASGRIHEIRGDAAVG